MKLASLWAVVLAATGASLLFAAAPPPRVVLPDEYRTYKTVKTAQKFEARVPVVPTARANPGYLGVTVEPEDGKLYVVGVEPGSPAAKAGLAPNDRLVSVDGKRVAVD